MGISTASLHSFQSFTWRVGITEQPRGSWFQLIQGGIRDSTQAAQGPTVAHHIEMPHMQEHFALKLLSEMLWTGLLVSMPLLGTTLIVGVAISFLQVITQVQEMSLTFVPKLVAAVLVLLACGSWMLGKIVAYSESLFSAIASL